MSGLRVADFDFELPEELIAQEPPAERGQSRMLVMDRESGAVRDSHFAEFPALLRAGDVLVLNDSRVIPARLFARRTLRREREAPTGRIEVMLTEPAGDENGALLWRALVRPGRKVGVGERLIFLAEDCLAEDCLAEEVAASDGPLSDGALLLEAEVLERGTFGERLLRFEPVEDFFAALEQIGHVPLPPYIHRQDAEPDRERYQTIFARERGSVAAPTAGLHFTEKVLAELQAKGVEVAHVTLHVGLGTFAPLRVKNVDEVRLHRERYTLPEVTAQAVNRARAEGRRVVAVGTTVVRTLEHCARLNADGTLAAHSGSTEIFIAPGFSFRAVDGLLTNFHLPQSSLLMLVSALAGRERVLEAYRHAVAARYRFFSYGDCMFVRGGNCVTVEG